MLTKPIAMWATNFYYKDLGLPVEQIMEDKHDSVNAMFQQAFAKHAAKLLYNDESHNITDEDIMATLTALKQVHIPDALHLFGKISEHFKNTPDNPANTLKEAFNTFKRYNTEAFAIVKGGTEFKTFAKDGELVGIYDESNKPVYLGDTSRFTKGLNLMALTKANPIKITDFCIDALKRACEAGIIQESDLCTQSYIIPTNDDFERVYVNALNPNLPGYFTRQLIELIPEAYINEFPSPYHAALDYAETHDGYTRARNELRDIIARYNTNNTKKVETIEDMLTDDIAINYLSKKYNIDATMIKDYLQVPTIDKTWDMISELAVKYPDKPVEELREMLPDGYAGVNVEDIILATLAECKLDFDMTLQEYFDYCKGRDYDSDNPDQGYDLPSIQDWVEEYCDKYNINHNVTIEDFIYGNTDVPEDLDRDQLSALRAIDNCPNISTPMKETIKKALNGEGKVNDIRTELLSIGVTGDVLKAIMNAKGSGVAFNMPKEELTPDKVATYLTQSGIPRVIANQLSEGNTDALKHDVTDSEVSDYLTKLGMNKTDILAITSGQIPSMPITEDEVYGYLLEKSMPDDIASQIASGVLPSSEPSIDQIIDYLINTGIEKDDADSIAHGNVPIKEVEPTVEEANSLKHSEPVNEIGYIVAESILHDLREAVMQNDTMELRYGMYGVVLGYMRLMMLKEGQEKDALEYLQSLLDIDPADPTNGKKALNDVTRPFIEHAIEKFNTFMK